MEPVQNGRIWMMSDDEITYSCYDCTKMRVCGIAREMFIIDDNYGRSIDGLYSILAENCKEFNHE